MDFERQEFNLFVSFLDSIAENSNIESRCIAENFTLEERLTTGREDNYQIYLRLPLDEQDWKNMHEDYLDERVYVKIGNFKNQFENRW